LTRAAVFLLAALAPALAVAAPLPAAEQAQVIEQTAKLVETRYVDPRAGRELARALRRDRSLVAPAEPEALARRLTAFLRDRAADGHFDVSWSERPLTPEDFSETMAAADIDRFYGPKLNHGVAKVERLDGNVMLLDLRVFPPPNLAGDVIAAAMTLVAQGDALVIDLRNNGGGWDSVNLVAGYLLPPGTQLSGVYDRPTDKLTPQTTAAWSPGRRFGAEKPVYVVIGKRTFSAAEALAYDLQALKRATIVGEVSGGGANPFAYRRLSAHFALSLPEQRSINPVTGANWQGVGVTPDVAAPVDRALDVAVALARAELARRASASQ
jgi:C-terminal processing protease CtpA/Prc